VPLLGGHVCWARNGPNRQSLHTPERPTPPFRDLPAIPTHCHPDIAPRLFVPLSLTTGPFYYVYGTTFSDPLYHFIFLHFLPTLIGLTWCYATFRTSLQYR